MAEFARCVAEIPAFLRDDGALDYDAVRNAAVRLAAAGWRSVAVAGLWSGEYDNLTCGEQTALIRAASEAGVEVCAGALEVGTDKARLRIAEHADAGCHRHICVCSHFFSINCDDELKRHFDILGEADPRGRLIIADSRPHTGLLLSPTMIATLAAQGNTLLIEAPDVAATLRLPSGFPVLVREELSLAGFIAFARISRLAVLFPRLMASPEKPSAPVRRALLEILATGPHPASGVKYAAWRLGLCQSPRLLPPSVDLKEEERTAIDAALAAVSAETEGERHD